jgi:hypothetical protein
MALSERITQLVLHSLLTVAERSLAGGVARLKDDVLRGTPMKRSELTAALAKTANATPCEELVRNYNLATRPKANVPKFDQRTPL